MRHGLRGQVYGTVSACAAGAHAIGAAARAIAAGDCDAVVTGGSEAAHTDLAHAAFASMDALSRLRHLAARSTPAATASSWARARASSCSRTATPPSARGATDPRRGARLRRDVGRLPPDRAAGRRRRAPRARSPLALRDAGLDARPTSTTSTPTARRRRSTTPPRPPRCKAALGDHARKVPVSSTKSVDRPPARRRRRRRGGRHRARAARARRPADRRLGGARRGPRPRLRPRRPAAARPPTAAPSPSPTRSGSAATTPCSPGRPHDAIAERPPVTLGPLDRLEALCDPGSLHVIRSEVTSWRMGDRARAGRRRRRRRRPRQRPPGLRLRAGHVLRRRLARRAARRHDRPRARSSPARRARRSSASSPAPARACRRASPRSPATAASSASTSASPGRVPQICVIAGTSAGGGSYSPALTDFVVMTRDSAMFLTGPAVVREVMGEDVDAAGARRRRACTSATASATTSSTTTAPPPSTSATCSPTSRSTPARTRRCACRADPLPGSPGDVVPPDPRKVYDVRDVIARVVDGGELLEVQPRWARNLVTGFARLDGRAVGVIANQPRWIGGVLDADSAQKGARFVRTCNTFNLPLLVFVDTPGFLPGTGQEQAGVIRHGAKLLHAFAEGEVPEADRRAAQGVRRRVHHHELARARRAPVLRLAGRRARRHGRPAGGRHHPPPRAAAEAATTRSPTPTPSEHLRASVAAADGHVDEIIEPADTRARLAWGLSRSAGCRGEATEETSRYERVSHLRDSSGTLHHARAHRHRGRRRRLRRADRRLPSAAHRRGVGGAVAVRRAHRARAARAQPRRRPRRRSTPTR